MTIEKIIIVTRKTRRQELIERFNTRSQDTVTLGMTAWF